LPLPLLCSLLSVSLLLKPEKDHYRSSKNYTGVYYAYDLNVNPSTIREIVPMTEAVAWVLDYWDSGISSPKGSPTYQREAVYRPSNTKNNASSLYVYTIYPGIV
jgi:hypothetical protein